MLSKVTWHICSGYRGRQLLFRTLKAWTPGGEHEIFPDLQHCWWAPSGLVKRGYYLFRLGKNWKYFWQRFCFTGRFAGLSDWPSASAPGTVITASEKHLALSSRNELVYHMLTEKQKNERLNTHRKGRNERERARERQKHDVKKIYMFMLKYVYIYILK